MINKKTTKFFLALYTLFLVIGLFPTQSFASSYAFTYEKKIFVDSPDYISDIEEITDLFTGVASFWSKDFNDMSLWIRSGDSSDQLGDWVLINVLDDVPDGDGIQNSWNLGEIVSFDLDNFFQYKVLFDEKYVGRRFNLKFRFFDISNDELLKKAQISSDNSGLGPNIISRNSWGANENYMTWEQEYSEIKAFVIHHTAGEEKTTIAQDEAVRNLYYGHAVSYGWGDIGYNYIIDIDGNIYEGRAGGNSVVAGHTLGYNYGTVGIVLIGDYNVRNVDTPQYNALIDLIAYKSFQNGIDPSGNVYLKNKTIPTIVGHKDLNATSCPGNTLYERINDIRVKATSKFNTYPVKQYDSSFISTDSSVKVYGGERESFEVKIKNAGNAYWLAKGDNMVDIRSSESNDFTTKLEDFGRSIEPGEIAIFNITIDPELVNKIQNYSFWLTQNGTKISGSDFNTDIEIVTPPYKATFLDKSPNKIVKPGKEVGLWVDFKNTGTNTWTSSDGFKLSTYDNKESVFYSSGDWVDNKTVENLSDINVNPGGKLRVSIRMTAPQDNGHYQEKFVLSSNSNLEGGNNLIIDWEILVSESDEDVSGFDQKIYSRNIADYNFEIISQSDYINTLPGETRDAYIQIKNTGDSNWYSDIFKMGTTNSQNRESALSNSSWESSSRIEMDQYKVAPSETARFSFQFTAPQTTGIYNEYFSFVGDDIGWTKDLGLFWQIVVSPPTYSAEYISQSPYISTSYGMSENLEVKFKNIGNITWDKDVVRLGTTRAYDRNSIFSDPSWLSSNRIAFVEDEVAPGKIATYRFNLNTNQGDGKYREYFGLVVDGLTWFGEQGLFWDIDIKPLFDDFSYVDQSPYMSMNTGETKQIWLEVHNAGTSAWQKTGSIPVRLATSNPRDNISQFINSNRVSMDDDEILPGENARFTFDITAPNTPGTYREYFTLVRDGKSWFKDIGIYWEINVADGSSQPIDNVDDNDSDIDAVVDGRVILSSTGPFIVVDGSEAKIAEGDSGDSISADHVDGQYIFDIGSNSYFSSSQIRFVPWSGSTYFEVTSYEDRPAWNTSLNDNKFKGVIEIRKSSDGSKLWVVNELNIEDYLKGVSESIDSFDLEYLKVASVAQRSYAYYHWKTGGRHRDDFLTLKNSRNGNGDDQIYQGYNFTMRADNVSDAVDATRGEIVTYDGESILAPYFNQSDGRTRAISEVWGYNQSDFP